MKNILHGGKVLAGVAAATLALGLLTSAVGNAAPAPAESGQSASAVQLTSKRPPQAVTGLTSVDPQLGRITIQWNPLPAEDSFVDRYEIYGSTDPAGPFGPGQLIGQTIYPHFTHQRLGPENQTWYYRVEVVDAAGKRSKPSSIVRAEAAPSAALNGQEIARIGEFDHKSLEFALSPNKSSRYPVQFPNDPDFTVGQDLPGADWSYIHPGPADKWAGSTSHRSTMRFDLTQPRDLVFELWLLDTHKSNPGRADLTLNGHPVQTITFEAGAMLGSTQGDATVEGTGLMPSYVQVKLPREYLREGENVLTLNKTSGSWHVYDALGVFDLDG